MTRKGIILGLVLTICACGGGGGSDSSDSPKFTASQACNFLGLKIFGGQSCSSSDSSIAKLNIQSSDPADDTLCSGVVIDSTHVLTAGHCLAFTDVVDITITVNGQSRQASSYIIHPGFDIQGENDAIFNDVAVITASGSLNGSALPIKLSSAPTEGDTIAVYGFGLKENGDLGDLQGGTMVLSNITGNHLFAVFENGASNPCNGDSGGPAVIIEGGSTGNPSGISLIGITSTGNANKACGEGDVTLFTNLQNSGVLSFIQANAPGVQLS